MAVDCGRLFKPVRASLAPGNKFTTKEIDHAEEIRCFYG
jgi:hypothetical protein